MKNIKKVIFTLMIFAAMLPDLAARSHKKSKSRSKEKSKPGMIILCNGTSSAGKSTLVKALHELYEDDFEIAGIDAYAQTHQFNGFANLRYHRFYKMIHKKALAGQNMLVDTVLYHNRYKKYDAMLCADGIQLIKILVYCPVDCLVDHVRKRNLNGNAMEHRTVSQAFRAFLALYTMHKKGKTQIIDTMHSSEMKAAVEQSLDVIARWSEKSKKRQHITNKKMVHKFDLDTPHQIFITPAHRWDLIVNTGINSPYEIAQQIAKFVAQRNYSNFTV